MEAGCRIPGQRELNALLSHVFFRTAAHWPVGLRAAHGRLLLNQLFSRRTLLRLAAFHP